MTEISLDKYTGCLIGGAIGDALGAPIEFMDLKTIQSTYGKNGVQDYVEFLNGFGEFTDDTQMTLFTSEGLLRAYHRSVLKGISGVLHTIVHHSYLRWLYTQGVSLEKDKVKHGVYDIEKGWLIKQKELFKQRAPGNTCLNALSSGISGTIDNPINDSKGCGTIMRVAPIGLFYNQNNKQAFKIACELSAITHGHPTGYLSAGFFASIISDLAKGLNLSDSIDNSIDILKGWEHHEETLNAVTKCKELFKETKNNKKHYFETIEKLGEGWIAEEALSISLYCSLLYENDFKKGVLYSINHSGDSDSTGSITGNILGLINDKFSIPINWIEKLRHSNIVFKVAEDLHTKIKGNSVESDNEWWEKYPGF
jgi:ADP-ribosylglycohydrolase